MEPNYQPGIHTGPLASVSDATLPCDRCGSFAALHWSWGARLCEACVARRHSALTSGRRVGTLVREVLRVLPELGGAAVLVALAPFPFVVALRLVWPIPDTENDRADTVADLGPTLAGGMLHGFATAVLTIVLLQILVDSGRRDYRAAMTLAWSRALAIAGLSVALSLGGELMFLLLKFAGYVLLWLGSAIAYPVLLHERASPIAAYMRSTYRVQGNYLRLLGATIVLCVPMILVTFVFVIASAGMPEESPIDAVALLEASAGLLTLPLTALSAILYVKLPPRIGAPPEAVRSNAPPNVTP